MSTRRDGYNVIFSRQFSNSIELGLSYAHVDARSDTNGDGSYDTDLVSLSAGAPDQVKLYVNFALYDWDGRFSWIKYDDKIYENTVYTFDGYQLTSLDFSREFSNGGTLGFAIQNLLDEQYIDLYSQISRNNNWYVAGVGRTISFSYNHRF